jgi:hypothetical protein
LTGGAGTHFDRSDWNEIFISLIHTKNNES